jgi:transposase InsO family protein
MREHELAARPKRAFRPRTTRAGERVAPNRIKDLAPSGPDQSWVSDITYVATREGWLYLAVILDFFSRKVVGWKLGETLEAELVVTALQNALSRREPPARPLLPFRPRLPIQQRGGAETADAAGG